MAAADKVSFTIRRPTPNSRTPSSGVESDGNYKVPSLRRHFLNLTSAAFDSPITRSTASSPGPLASLPDSDISENDDDEPRDEFLTALGTQHLHPGRLSVSETQLVIPALRNRDWREISRKRKITHHYLPSPAQAFTGLDGSVGGLGVRDTISPGSTFSGIQIKREERNRDQHVKQVTHEGATIAHVKEEGEEERAIRAILSGKIGVSEEESATVRAIPLIVSEVEAYRQDVEELPDSSTLEDYQRVPVAQFGAAMLRGMGWKEGAAATHQAGEGSVEIYLPQPRPALLGIGAKEQEVYDDGSKKRSTHPEKKYVPVVRMGRDIGYKNLDRLRSPPSQNDSNTNSRPSSKSRNRRDHYDDIGRGSLKNDRHRDRNRSYHEENHRRSEDFSINLRRGRNY